MIIRAEQMRVLRKAEEDAFTLEMADHLAAYAPRLYELRGRDVFLRVAVAGRERAEALGFTFRGPVRMILESMVTFGHEFYSDPQLPLIRRAMQEANPPDEMVRAELVFERIQEYWKTVVGLRGEYAIEALERVQTLAGAGAAPDSTETLLKALQWAYPLRFDHAGEAAMRQMVDRAGEISAQHGLSNSAEGVTLLSALMFGFGHGVLNDPLYPWVSSALNDPLIAGAADRFARLRQRTIVYMDHVLEHWKKVYAR